MIAGRDALWARVHEHLDAGSDPLEDGVLLDAIAEDPELLAAVVRLRDDLTDLRRAMPRRPRRAAARRLPWLVAAGAAAGAVWLLRPVDPREAPPPPAPVGRVVAFRAVAIESTPDLRVVHRVELGADGRVVDRRTTTFTWRPATPPAASRPAVLSFTAQVAEE